MGEYPEHFWQFGIQCLRVAVSMEISPQRDIQEVVRGIGQNFPLLVYRAMPVVKGVL
ncbi:MAG: hypothetical protein RM022_024905 [Nostoc sp. EfeVER01]|jgi:hypothetical protein|uniref:hypothetical protein n=1 Tax=Nostoc sp. EfeVER01 TaxID=3075406 RepID=UPI002AD3C349|nr:hypothetical protein [Nostoc sp. EfeVER01]MDZ7943627.1 hypothetical protein [Nostoc sp. EfeVER01]